MAKAPAVKWLNREFLVGPYLCLVKNEAEWAQAFADLGVSPDGFPSSSGRCVTLKNQDGKLAAIVLIQAGKDRNSIEVAGLLVHEAVHVAQAFFADIGETNPGDETQAYIIQTISQRLMAQWCGEDHA